MENLVKLLKRPGTDIFDPWRCRLGAIIVLFPAFTTILLAVPTVLDVLEWSVVGSTPDLRDAIETYMETSRDAVFHAAWLGLIVYGILRGFCAGSRRLVGLVAGYWIVANCVLRFLLSLRMATISFDLMEQVVNFCVFCVAWPLVGSFFWVVAKAIRARLVYPGETNTSLGLNLRNVLMVVLAFALLLSGMKILYAIIESSFSFVDIGIERFLISFVLWCLVFAGTGVSAFFARNTAQLILSATLVGGLQAGWTTIEHYWSIRFFTVVVRFAADAMITFPTTSYFGWKPMRVLMITSRN